MKNERLMPLRAMKDYQVSKDSLDVMGWRVVGADGESLGTVKDLIVDTQVMKVRYLSVLAENKYFSTESDQHILVPIGAAALDKRGKNVFISYLDSRTISQYPVYAGDHIPTDYEYAVRESLQKAQNSTLPDTSGSYRQEFDESIREDRADARPITEDFYENEAYDANRFYASDQEVNREKTHTSTDRVRTESTTDLHDEGSKSKTVEDSIATIERLERLRERGSITEEEFILMKKRALDQ